MSVFLPLHLPHHPLTSYALDDAIRSQKAFIINEVSTHTRVNLDIYRALNIIPRNLICFPTLESNTTTTLGLLLVINKLSVHSNFSSFDLWCLEYISSYIATAHSLKQQSQTLSSQENIPPTKNLNITIPPDIASSPSPVESVIEHLIDRAYHALQADKISLFLPNETSNQLICTISRDIKGMQVSMDEGVVGQTLKSKSPIHSRNVRENIHHSNSMDTLTGYQTVSLLSYPILSKNGSHVLGVLQAINKLNGEEDFTAEDHLYFTNLSTSIGELLSNQTESHFETLNLNIMKSLGDYSFSSAYSYRSHLYDSWSDFNELRVQELISYCKLICSTDHVLMYSLQQSTHTSSAALTPLATQDENDVTATPSTSTSIGLEMRYVETLSKTDSGSIANPSSGEYGSIYSMPSYQKKNIPVSVLKAIQQNRILHITQRNHVALTLAPLPSSGMYTASTSNSDDTEESDENYLRSVNSTAAIIIPIHLVYTSSTGASSSSRHENESPIDVLIILKTNTALTPSSTHSKGGGGPLPSLPYLFNLSRHDFSSYQSNGIHSLFKIFNCTYQLSLSHRQEMFNQSILENKIHIMDETLVQLDTMFCLLSGDGRLKLYNTSFEDFLGLPNNLLESFQQSQPSPTSTEEYKLMDIQLDLLFPSPISSSSPSCALAEAFHEAIRSGKIVHQQNALVRTWKYPTGIRVNFEIYEYYGHHTQHHHSKSNTHQHTPSPNKKRTKKSLSKLESFHFENSSSSPLQDRRFFTGRTGKLYRLCLRYVDDDTKVQEVIKLNTGEDGDRHTSPHKGRLLEGIVRHTQEEVEEEDFVLQTTNTILTPCKQRGGSDGHEETAGEYASPRSPMSTPRVNPLSPTTTSSLSQLTQLPVLFTWDFNSLEVPSPEHQKHYALLLLEKNVNVTELNIPKAYFYSLVSEIESNYYANPFHNFQHALCVLQFLYMLLEVTNYPPPASGGLLALQGKDRKKRKSNPLSPCPPYHHLIPADYLYLTVLLSALFHDIRHPGNTNSFEIHSQSAKALVYNDQSVLENYHCSTAFHLLRVQKNNIFVHYSFEEMMSIRKVMISCILATDMSLHTQLIHQIQDRTKRFAPEIANNDYASITLTGGAGGGRGARAGQQQSGVHDEMIFYCKILLHCADLSNPVRPFPISKRWAELVSEEFNEQGQKEEHLQLPLSSFLLSPNLEILVKNEIYFCQEIVLPLWKSMELYFPRSTEFHQFAQQIHHNSAQWKDRLSGAAATCSSSLIASPSSKP
jgi:hypothetical protein